MKDREFSYHSGLEERGVKRMGIKNNQIFIIFKNHIVKADLQGEFMETIFDIRNKLDELIDDIRLRESIISDISKNYYRCLITETKNIEEKQIELSEDNEDLKDLTVEDWNKILNELLLELLQVVKNNFPNLWDCLEFQLSVKNILHINNCNLPFAGIILGPPSSMKTIGIELFRNVENTFYSDNFSPKSFVSHATSVKREELVNVDLLPKIKGKLFLTPELSPIFGKKEEDLTELLGILIRILDGKGYESDSGTQGHRGYSGEFMFTWLGAAVEISHKVHKLLSTLGPKLYFYRIPKMEKSENELLKQIQGIQFNKKFLQAQNKLQKFLDWFQKYPNIVNPKYEKNVNEIKTENTLLKIEWDESKDDEKSLRIMIRLAKLLSPLRGILQTWETNDSQGAEYAYSYPIIEEPDRAITQLRNLARGHALIYGRNYITLEDIPLLIKVVLSTASIERVKVLDLLLNAEGDLTTSQIANSLNVSYPTAKRTMVEFKGLGIVDMIDGVYENSEKSIQLKSKYLWFLQEEFKTLRENFTPDFEHNKQIMTGSCMLQEKTSPSTLYDDPNQHFNTNMRYEKPTTTPTNQDAAMKEEDLSNNPTKPVDSTDQFDRGSINKQHMYRLWKGGDKWGCQKCSFRGDKWDLLAHICKNNK